ncbi:unnamed protein product [Thelazia callipaeda]|uniref:TMF_TATA_bd domain-containing protein n=1 Tax=Thelazia callipaeda TaxID=103827 RepID=A0A158RC83_THECL|nr:unnamed protein product [Thelazia callipaeda]
MNFTWANELAKNALKTAQKRIDSVLDITAEDEAESEEAVHNVIIPSVNESLEELQLENHDVWNEASTSFCSVFDGTSTVEVVCSEPNPIRDNDLAELLPCSPCSNSPEELVCSVGDQDVQVTGDVQQSNGFSKLEPNVLEDTKHVLVEKSSQKTDKHHDDTLTLISSDFEILRPGDASSMVSSVPKILPVLKESALTVTTLTEVTKEGNNGNLVDKQAASADIMHLKTQLQYQERRIRDLQFQNQRLEAKSNELLALKAVRTQQSSTEAKLMKILSEKETKLADLLREGEKLAETNGKLTKELKKLRNNLVEQEQLAKQNDEMRTDRDLACEEVRSLTAETTKLRNLVKSLESDLVKLKLSNDSLIADLNRRDIEIKKLEGEIQQSEANRESALKEVKVILITDDHF